MLRRADLLERLANAGALLDALSHPHAVDLTVLSRPDPPLSAPVRESLLRHPLIVLGLVALGTAALVVTAELLLRR